MRFSGGGIRHVDRRFDVEEPLVIQLMLTGLWLSSVITSLCDDDDDDV